MTFREKLKIILCCVLLAVVSCAPPLELLMSARRALTAASQEKPAPAVSAPVDPGRFDTVSALPYFLPENFGRYMRYAEQNPGLSADKAVAFVNVGLDVGGYESMPTAKITDEFALFINFYYGIGEDFIDSKLLMPSGLMPTADAAFREMKSAMNLPLFISTSYVSYSEQLELGDRFARDNPNIDTGSVLPGCPAGDYAPELRGHSEHQIGLAADVIHVENPRYADYSAFEHTAQYAWLEKNAYLYGFILRYPKAYEQTIGHSHEPRHLRYVGRETARVMHDEGIETFEEYCGKYLYKNYNYLRRAG